MSSDYPKAKVIIALALGLTSFGFAPIIVKLASDYSAFQVSAVRTVLAAVILFPFYYFRPKEERIATKVAVNERWWMAASGILLGLHFISWTSSIYFTSVASASVLVTVHPIILILVERLLFRVKFAATIWIGVIVAFMGSVILGYSDYNAESTFSNPALGNFLAFLAAVIFAIYFLIGRKVRKNHNWIDYVFPVYSWAALTCTVVLFVLEGFSNPIEGKLLLLGLGMALGPQIMGHGSLNFAIKYVSPTLLSTLILVEPLLASLLALLIFQEWPELSSLIAMVIILLGVSLTWKKTNKETISNPS